eukprot:scaffold10085_cov155-Cylindrotheca_fusiformis.AAC.4
MDLPSAHGRINVVWVSFILFFLPSWFVQGNGSVEDGTLLNAYLTPPNSVADAMVPGSVYFLEFPRPDSDPQELAPMCADRSPYSFLFQRGSNSNYKKIIVEIEGGPACWEEGQCSCDPKTYARQAPWQDYYSGMSKWQRKRLPWIGSCHGMSPAVLERVSPDWSRDSTSSITLMEGEDLDSWSYLLLPHCTLDWNLGFRENPASTDCLSGGDGQWASNEVIWHRGGVNMEAVLDWLSTQFQDDDGGLDAMMVFSGGTLAEDSCQTQQMNTEGGGAASRLAPVLFANEAARRIDVEPSSILLVVDSIETPSAISEQEDEDAYTQMTYSWAPMASVLYPSAVRDAVLNSPPGVDVAWIASSQANSNIEDLNMLRGMAQERPGQFHVYFPTTTEATASTTRSSNGVCARFGFPESDDFVSFLQDIDMSWVDTTKFSYSEFWADVKTDKGAKRLSFLSIAVMALGLWALLWVVYWGVKYHRAKQGNELPPPMSPNDIWMHILTHYPFWFLLVSLAIPISLSVVALARSGYTIPVNLEFNTYLDISSNLNVVADAYSSAQKYQQDSVKEGEEQCATLLGIQDRRLQLEEGPELQFFSQVETDNYGRALEGETQKPTRASITVIYENRNGGNVFEPEVLASMYDFEQAVRDFPGFETFCRRRDGECRPFDTVLSFLYPDGQLVDDIEQVLVVEAKNTQVDQYFSVNNPQSNITRSQFFFEGQGSALNDFME